MLQWLRRGAAVLYIVAIVAFCALATARVTLLDAVWYQNLLEREDVYDRLYEEVLVDPELRELTDDLVADLPIDRSLVDSNLRLVIPPEALRESFERAITSITEFLRGRRDQIDATFAIEPLRANLERLAHAYAGDLASSLDPIVVQGIDEFEARYAELLADVDAGRRPDAFPDLPPLPGAEEAIADVLLQTVENPRRGLHEQVIGAIAAGDVNSAIALTLAEGLDAGTVSRSYRSLREQVGGTVYDFGEEVLASSDDPVLNAVARARGLIGEFLVPGLLVTGALVLLALIGVAAASRALGQSALRPVAMIVLIGGLVLGGCWGALRLVFDDPLAPLVARSSSLPAGTRDLLGDLGGRAMVSLDEFVLRSAGLAAFVGIVALVLRVVLPRVVSTLRAMRRVRVAYAIIGAGAAAAVAVVFAVLWPEPSEAEPVCNGQAELCRRRVDEVIFPVSHNAMSASDLGWISANQDIGIRDQLNLGIRGLMLDIWEWETPDRVLRYVTEFDVSPEYEAFVRTTLEEVNPPRRGTFLCHNLCKLGFTPLEQALAEIRAWLDENPNDVLVLLVEDHVPVARINPALHRSGLERFVYVRESTDAARWPTLEELVETDQRVLLFTENSGGTKPWHMRAYDHIMETPYTFQAPNDMSCRSNRGGTGKSLFLLNHWIQRTAPSRVDAGVVNRSEFLLGRIRDCARQRSRLPNLIATDFVNVGDLLGVVERLNRVDG